MSPPDEWLHFVLYPGSALLLDRAVLEVAGPAAAAAAAVEPTMRWFFLRFTDQGGVHLRVRFSAPAGRLDAVEDAVAPVLRQRLFALAAGNPAAACRQGFYEPEPEKFGDADGLRAAEHLFEASSRLALRALAQTPSVDVAALALAAMTRLVGVTVPEDHIAAFWRRYVTYWDTSRGVTSSSPAGRAGWEARLADVQGSTTLGSALDQWEAAAHHYRAELDAAGLPALEPAFHQVHLTNNRLGVPPVHEAALGRRALLLNGS